MKRALPPAARVIAAMALALLAGSSARAQAQVIEESFDAGAACWEGIAGDWRVEEGADLQADASSPAYRMSLLDSPWREGSIEATATALERNRNGNVGATFGLVIKHIDEQHWCIARFGSYGRCSLLIRRGEEKQRVNLGGFSPEIGHPYRVGAIVGGGLIAVVREGVAIAILDDPFPGEAGRPGLFTETRCRFDDVRIELIEQ